MTAQASPRANVRALGGAAQAASVRPNRRTSKARIRAVSPAPRRNSAATARAVRRLASVVVDKDGISG